MSADKLMTTAELATYCDVDVRTIYRWRTLLGLPHRRAGRTFRYLQADVDRWMIAQAKPPCAPVHSRLKEVR